MNKVISILMQRDGMTLAEARDAVADAREQMEEAASCGDYDLAEEIMSSELGLEPDYIFDVLGLYV